MKPSTPATILLYSGYIPEPVAHALVDTEAHEWLSSFPRWLYRRVNGVIKPPRVAIRGTYASMHHLVVLYELALHRHLSPSEILIRLPYIPRVCWNDPLDCRLASLSYIEPIHWPFKD